jgi:hypothetical protein
MQDVPHVVLVCDRGWDSLGIWRGDQDREDAGWPEGLVTRPLAHLCTVAPVSKWGTPQIRESLGLHPALCLL